MFTKTELVDGNGKILTVEDISLLRERSVMSRLIESGHNSNQPLPTVVFNANSSQEPILTSTPQHIN